MAVKTDLSFLKDLKNVKWKNKSWEETADITMQNVKRKKADITIKNHIVYPNNNNHWNKILLIM